MTGIFRLRDRPENIPETLRSAPKIFFRAWTGGVRQFMITNMPSLEKISISPALTFDALVGGESAAPLVLLLHGFAESMHCWRAQVAALAAAG